MRVDEWRAIFDVHRSGLSCAWRDQGWGNQKGQFVIQLVRGAATAVGGMVVAECVAPLGLAPHVMEASLTRRPRFRSFAHSVLVYPCTLASSSSSSLAWPLVPFQLNLSVLEILS